MNLRERITLARSRDLTLGTLLERMLEVHGDRPLVEEHGTGLKLSYGEAADRTARLAQGITEKIDLGDAVVIAVPNGYELFLLCLAASRAGGRSVPVNPKMRDSEIQHVIDDSGAPLVIRDPAEVEAEKPMSEAIAAQPDDIAAIFYTSGTTGKPKGAELTHRALAGGAAGGVLFPSGMRDDEVVAGMPVAHIAGFSLLVMSAVMGIPTYLLPKFRPDDALDAIESRRATVFIGVPAMYRMMLEAGAEQRDLRSIRLWASGADSMPEDLAAAFKKMGAAATLPILQRTVGQATFVDGYGMVELSGGVAVKVSLPMLTLPMIPLPGYKLKVIDDAGNEVSRGTVGELAVKGPGVLKGYHGNREATDEVLTPDGWLRTGDLGRRGLFGLVTFAGRKKHVIKHGGYSVFAVEVEKALEEHPDVLEAAVVGLPDERKGEVPVAAVRVRDGARIPEDELVTWAREHLSDYKAPREIRIVDELPRTATDKVQKDRVLELFGVESDTAP
jgi:long-chain acyl-CoA synthetase